MTVIVGNNAAGKTAILEALAVSLGTFFDGLDVQGQYPVEIDSTGQLDGKTVSWKRTLDGEKGRTTGKGAADFIEAAKIFQKRLRALQRQERVPPAALHFRDCFYL